VTMPHKSDVAMLVDERSETAELLGAVNCITRQADRLIGINTDGEGFLEALGRGANIDVLGLRCLVLGAGGAARAVVHALGVAGALEVAVWARRIERAEEVATLAGAAGRTGAPEEAGGMDLVVNATSAGMAGSRGAGESPPVGPELLGSGQVVVDLIYQPPVTSWLEAASGRGATVVGGLGMLVHQAAGQLRTWTGFEAPLTEMWRAVQDAVEP